MKHSACVLILVSTIFSAITADAAEPETYALQILENAYRHPAFHRISSTLDSAILSFNTGQVPKGWLAVQQLLDAPSDGWIHRANNRQLTSFRRQIDRLFESLPRETRQEYERLHGQEAEIRLRQTGEIPDPVLLTELIRRFGMTRAGTLAYERLATGFLDHGQIDLAAACFWKLLTSRVHRPRLQTESLLKAWIALEADGRRTDAEVIGQKLLRKEIKLAGESRTFRDWQTQFRSFSPAETRGLPFGDTTHNGDHRASSPFLVPRWSSPLLTSSSHPDISALIAQWSADQVEAELPNATSVIGLAVPEQILVRGPDGLRALDVRTGEMLWKYRAYSSMETALRMTDAQSMSNDAAEKTAKPFVTAGQTYVSNAVIGVPTANSSHVFLVDYLNIRRLRPGSSALEQSGIPVANRLVAIRIDGGDRRGKTRQPDWSVGGLAVPGLSFLNADRDFDFQLSPQELGETLARFQQQDANRNGSIEREEFVQQESDLNPLNGHCFLGSPLPYGGRLYAITETDRQLNLVCLDAPTGRLIWHQPIGFSRLNIDRDHERSILSCMPAASRGIIVCPTGTDLLVGVDAVTGNLLWNGYIGSKSSLQAGRATARLSRGHPGFINLPMISDDRVLVMPRFSDFIHCLDLQTGQSLWKSPRETVHTTGISGNGDEYIGAIAEGIVVVVGNRSTRGLSLTDGSEQWSTFVEWPAGRGVRSGSHYILPLRDGRVINLEIRTGTIVGASSSEFAAMGGSPEIRQAIRDWKPGNLLATGTTIVSVGPEHVTSFVQASARRSELMSSQPDSPVTQIELAQVDLALGNLSETRKRLELLLQETIGTEMRIQAVRLLREVLHLQLNSSPPDPLPLLARLDELAVEPDQRAEYLLRASEILDSRRDDRMRTILGELIDSSDERLFRNRLEPVRWTTLRTRIRSLATSLQSDPKSEFSDTLRQLVSTRAQTALASEDIHRMRSEFLKFGSVLPYDRLSRELASRLVQQGRFQEAELVLLSEIQAKGPRTNSAAEKLLKLYDQTRLHVEAVTLLNRIEPSVPEQRRILDRIAASGLLRDHFEQRQPFSEPIHHLQIRQTNPRDNDPQVLMTFTGFRSRDFALGENSSFLMLDKGNDQRSRLTLIDRLSGYPFRSIETPSGLSSGLNHGVGKVGHYLSAVSRDNRETHLWGLSLIPSEGQQPLWTRRLELREHFTRAGPAGPNFAVFQYADRLLCVHPGDGSILWERRGIPHSAGLVNDPYAGLFGDHRALVMFDSDRAGYTVYETMTGRILRQGRLEFGRRIRAGRLLVFDHRSKQQRTFRIWDPWTNQILLEREVFQPVAGRIFCAPVENDPTRILLLVDRGTLLIWNNEEQSVEQEIQLQDVDWTDLIGLRVLLTPASYLVCLKQQHLQVHLNLRNPQSQRRWEPMPAGFHRFTRVNGILQAIDRKTGQRLWSRNLGSDAILHHPFNQLPFLLTFARQRIAQSTSLMTVSAIAERTGEELGHHPSLFPDQPLLIDYDVNARMLQIQCVHSRIEVDFSNRSRDPMPQVNRSRPR